MSEKDFWSIIEESRACLERGYKGTQEEQEEALRNQLLARQPQEVHEFALTLNKKVALAYRRELRAVVTLIVGSCSEDTFTDFRLWLVSMGKDVFEKALEDPDSLIEAVCEPVVPDLFFESFQGIAPAVLESMNGGELCYPPLPELEGPKWTERDLAIKLPRLWSRFGPDFESERPATDEEI